MENIQVIERAAALLEVIGDSLEPRTMTFLAEETKLKLPTVARIVRTLTNLGYIEQVDRKTGYILGSKVFNLVQNKKCYSALQNIAAKQLAVFSQETKEYVCISVLRGNKRVILKYIPAIKIVQINTSKIIFEETPYRTISGHVLLSSLSETELRKFYRQNGCPGEFWPEVDSEDQFIAEMDKIRKKSILITKTSEVISLAMPIYNQKKIIAAVGTYIPAYRYTRKLSVKIRKALTDLSKSIMNKIQSLNEKDY
ncbi:MAG: helix-turn-helix domain-containing protein [Lentisphaeria bacterium]